MPTALRIPPPRAREMARERMMQDTPYWAQHCARIVDKAGELVALHPKPGQLELDRALEAQRAAGLPMRVIILKARQVGMSTWVQAKMLHRCTLRARYSAVVVAHNRDTGAHLYRIGETIYRHLPDESPELQLKPGLGQHRRQRFLHFGAVDSESWKRGDVFPDSTYLVDTAGEFQAGRGGTYQAVHASEAAFWEQPERKLAALKAAVPRNPETLFVIESTANGHNHFKDLWDDAEAGRGGYVPIFWPWWREPEYQLGFVNEAEREAFIVGDPHNPYAEAEPELQRQFELSLEQLHWRRQAIADECSGDVRIFHQEFPSSAAEAFISTGQKVFDPYRVAQIIFTTERTDPRVPTPEAPGPWIGRFEPAERVKREARVGTVEVPHDPDFQPRWRGEHGPLAWKLWLSAKPSSEYVVGVDVSGGQIEQRTHEPDYHAIEVIDHRTREQVAEYRSRIDPDLLAEEVLMAALYFREAWVAVERTGSWGQPVLRKLWFDFNYPYVYRSRKIGHTSEKTEHRLGWDTTMRTKPLMVAGLTELVRLGDAGIKSRELAAELSTYARDEKGAMGAEPRRYDDLLSAYMIAQQVASERPLRHAATDGAPPRSFQARDSLRGYDARLAR